MSWYINKCAFSRVLNIFFCLFITRFAQYLLQFFILIFQLCSYYRYNKK